MKFLDLGLNFWLMTAFAKSKLRIYSDPKVASYDWAKKNVHQAHNMLFTVAQQYPTVDEIFAQIASVKPETINYGVHHFHYGRHGGQNLNTQKQVKTLRDHRLGRSRLAS